MDAKPVDVPKISWQRFTCRRGANAAGGAIGSELARPDRCIVVVGADLRRLFLVWRWLGDLNLAADILSCLRENGGEPFEVEDD
jgi:hypothetical protein